MPWSRWAAAAERAGNRLLAMQPDWLIIVGGVSSNNDLSGARDRPIILEVDDRVVYEAHVYGWSGKSCSRYLFGLCVVSSFLCSGTLACA